MKKPDWIIHYVVDSGDDAPDGGLMNAHTHGMEKYGHMDFQVVLNCDQKLIAYVLNVLGDRVRNGETFDDGDMVDGVFKDVPVKLVKKRETGRDLLRVVIPDDEGRFPGDPGCADVYRLQELDMFMGDDAPEGWTEAEYGLYKTVMSNVNVSECGWVEYDPVMAPEFCIWVPHARLEYVIGTLQAVYGRSAFEAPGVTARIQKDATVISLGLIGEGVDLEKLFPRDQFKH